MEKLYDLIARPGFSSTLVLLLVLLPLASAIFVPMFGRSARRVALILAQLHLGLTVAVAVLAIPVLIDREDMDRRVPEASRSLIRPNFIPGSQPALPAGLLRRSRLHRHRCRTVRIGHPIFVASTE